MARSRLPLSDLLRVQQGASLVIADRGRFSLLAFHCRPFNAFDRIVRHDIVFAQMFEQ